MNFSRKDTLRYMYCLLPNSSVCFPVRICEETLLLNWQNMYKILLKKCKRKEGKREVGGVGPESSYFCVTWWCIVQF
jgi:hypothetical protein